MGWDTMRCTYWKEKQEEKKRMNPDPENLGVVNLCLDPNSYLKSNTV